MGILKKLIVGSLAVGAATAVYANRSRVQKELKKTVKLAKKTLNTAKKNVSKAVSKGKKNSQ